MGSFDPGGVFVGLFGYPVDIGHCLAYRLSEVGVGFMLPLIILPISRSTL